MVNLFAFSWQRNIGTIGTISPDNVWSHRPDRCLFSSFLIHRSREKPSAGAGCSVACAEENATGIFRRSTGES